MKKNNSGQIRDRFLSLAGRAALLLSLFAVLLTGPIVIRLPADLAYLQEFAKRMGIFMLILLLWEALLRFIISYIVRPARQYSRARKLFFYSAAFLLSASTLYCAGHLEDKITHTFLAVLLIALGLRGLSAGLKIADFKGLSFFALMLYFFAVSNLSSAITSAGWHWQFLVVALAMQSGFISRFCLQSLRNLLMSTDKTRSDSHINLYSRANAVSLISAPGAIAVLHYYEMFPKSYLLCFLSLAFSIRAAEQSRKIEKNLAGNDSERMAIYSKVDFLSSFAVIIFLLSFIAAAYIEF